MRSPNSEQVIEDKYIGMIAVLTNAKAERPCRCDMPMLFGNIRDEPGFTDSGLSYEIYCPLCRTTRIVTTSRFKLEADTKDHAKDSLITTVDWKLTDKIIDMMIRQGSIPGTAGLQIDRQTRSIFHSKSKTDTHMYIRVELADDLGMKNCPVIPNAYNVTAYDSRTGRGTTFWSLPLLDRK